EACRYIAYRGTGPKARGELIVFQKTCKAHSTRCCRISPLVFQQSAQAPGRVVKAARQFNQRQETSMATHKVKLTRSKQVAEGTVAFYFEKPEGFQFEAGQFLRFTLIDSPETDEEGDARTFSIASAPHEAELMIATRMRFGVWGLGFGDQGLGFRVWGLGFGV